ncbi:MAG: type I-U CRISPR-associated helicase/endonuclease Cas3 [Labilithrix sp.]|nr:type I-U CRISPR-associated helicase/endonuclease Cas3 [Labilithrix sp.]
MDVDLHAPDAFAAFYRAVHGRAPFPWQRRLAEHVCASDDGGWPPALDVPTGAGKTSALDVAVFHLAREAARAIDTQGGASRRAPLRICLVVDRRLVVDDAFKHAQAIARSLRYATGGILGAVARPLRALATVIDDDRDVVPLAVARLRGGAPKDRDWVRSPSQPTLVISTVDQVGSRLLFRGYGVPDRMKSVHAGLIGNDVLVLLDEAHLSNPFLETLHAVGKARGTTSPFTVVTLSATQREAAPELILPEDLDDDAPRSLGRRMRAMKPAKLLLLKEPATVTSGEENDAFALAFAERAQHYIRGGDARAVAVVVNRVRRARVVFDELRRRIRSGTAPPTDVVLLTGRSRPMDRDKLLEECLPRMTTSRSDAPSSTEKPLVVVATQCIEAGADLDFDALVTEIAPLDCLRQRFGRLNRMGRPIEAQATILASVEQVGARAKGDPIYGDTARNTWALLAEKAKAPPKKKGKSDSEGDALPLIDFGIEASKAWLPARSKLAALLAPAGSTGAPRLTPGFVAQWACTSPVPAVEADVSLFLHGPKSGPADVQIVWRADIEDDDVPAEELLKRWTERVAACPPSSLEALSVPYGEVLRWLARTADGDIADVEGAEDDEPRAKNARRRALRWRGRDDAKLVTLDAGQEGDLLGRLSPGDTVVVPAKRGGADEWGWNPSLRGSVVDLGECANRRHRGRDILRLSSALLQIDAYEARLEEARREAGVVSASTERAARKAAARARQAFERIFPSTNDEARASFTRDEIEARLLGFDVLPQRWRVWISAGSYRVHRSADGQPLALERPVRATPSADLDADSGEGFDGDRGCDAATEDDESSSFSRPPEPTRKGTQVAVLLARHSEGVGSLARTMALRAGLPPARVDDIALAGLLHDAGKAHPQFQALLFGGDEVAAEHARLHGKPLAKSAGLALDGAARRRAKLPRGARHEVASLWFALAHPALNDAVDRDLVLWLIGTHHGHGRPFFPATEWPAPGETFRLDLDGGGLVEARPALSLAALTARWTTLHRELTRRYRPWELAHYETLIRLADHRSSELEQREAFRSRDGQTSVVRDAVRPSRPAMRTGTSIQTSEDGA